MSIQVVSIRQHHNGGVCKLGLTHNLVGVEDHGDGLARALGVPDDPNATIAIVGRGTNTFDDCLSGGVELMIAGNLLDVGVVGFPQDEVADVVKQTMLLKHAFEQDFQLNRSRWGKRIAIDGSPRHKTFKTRSQ